MTRFTLDNTSGFSPADLADMNAAFSVRKSELRCQGVDVDAKDAAPLLAQLAERIQTDQATWRILADRAAAAAEGARA